MKDQDKSNAQLLAEVAVLKRRVSELESSDGADEQNENSLQESDAIPIAMLHSIGDHISMMDTDLNIVWANDTAKWLFGDDIVGKKCYEAYHRRDEPCEPIPCLTQRAFTEDKICDRHTVVDKNGRTVYFHCTANVALRDGAGKPKAVIEISRDITKQTLAEQERDRLIDELRQALASIKTLKGLLPICTSCKKIRDDQGYWHQVESYIGTHSGADFSHGICPDCAKQLYPNLYRDEP